MLEERKAGPGRSAFVAVLVVVGLAAIALAAIVAIQPAWVGASGGSVSTPTVGASKGPSAFSPPVASAAPTSVRPTMAATTKPGMDPSLSADINTAKRVVDKFWARHWSEYFPGAYQPPQVVGTYDGSSPNSPLCGSQRMPEDNAAYCRPQDYLAWDMTLMARGYKDGDSWPYLVIAHEWGHAIQARIGKTLTSTASELQADCMAGATLFGAAGDGDLVLEPGDQKELATALSSLADETAWTTSSDHGDPFERIGAFDQGRLNGLFACIPDLKPATLGGSLMYRGKISVSVRTVGYRELTPVSPSAPHGRALIFEISVSNTGSVPFNAQHMSTPTVRYGDTGLIGELVPDPKSVLGPNSLPTIQPGETKAILIGAVVPEGGAASTVRISVPGPNPETDLSAIFEGRLP